MPLHRARYSVDGDRLLGGYCYDPVCAREDRLFDLAEAMPIGTNTWVSLDLDGRHVRPWKAAPRTIAERFAVRYEIPDIAATLLALIYDDPRRLLHPLTLLAAAHIRARDGAVDRITLSSLLVDAYDAANGDPLQRCSTAIERLAASLPSPCAIADFDREAARSWLAEQGVSLPVDPARADVEIWSRVSRSPFAWSLPSGAFAIEAARVGAPLLRSVATREAIRLLLDRLPDGARVTRYAPDARGSSALPIAQATRWLATDEILPVPTTHHAELLRRLPIVLEHPQLREREPSPEVALAWLRGNTVGAELHDYDATHLLAALLAEPYRPPFERVYAHMPATSRAIGPIAAVVGIGGNGELSANVSQIATPIAWAVDAGEGLFVLVADVDVRTRNASASCFAGMILTEDGAWLANADEQPLAPQAWRGDDMRVFPLTVDGDGWLGYTEHGALIRVAGEPCLGPHLLLRNGARVDLGMSRELESTIRLIAPDASTSLRWHDDLPQASFQWGPVVIHPDEHETRVGGATSTGAPRRVKLLVGDVPLEPGVAYRVLDVDDASAMVGAIDTSSDVIVAGCIELSLTDVQRKFKGGVIAGGVLHYDG